MGPHPPATARDRLWIALSGNALRGVGLPRPSGRGLILARTQLKRGTPGRLLPLAYAPPDTGRSRPIRLDRRPVASSAIPHDREGLERHGKATTVGKDEGRGVIGDFPRLHLEFASGSKCLGTICRTSSHEVDGNTSITPLPRNWMIHMSGPPDCMDLYGLRSDSEVGDLLLRQWALHLPIGGQG